MESLIVSLVITAMIILFPLGYTSITRKRVSTRNYSDDYMWYADYSDLYDGSNDQCGDY